MILFLKVFFTEFIAEMGDKTQLMLDIVSLIFTSQENIYLVILHIQLWEIQILDIRLNIIQMVVVQ